MSAGLLATASACTSESGSVEAFCEAVADIPPLATVVTGFAETHPAEMESRLVEAEAAYAELRAAAPGEIDSEVDQVVDLADEIMAAVREHSEDRDAAADRIRGSIADHPEAQEASAAVVAYASEHCGLTLDPTPDEEAARRPGGPPADR